MFKFIYLYLIIKSYIYIYIACTVTLSHLKSTCLEHRDVGVSQIRFRAERTLVRLRHLLLTQFVHKRPTLLFFFYFFFIFHRLLPHRFLLPSPWIYRLVFAFAARGAKSKDDAPRKRARINVSRLIPYIDYTTARRT